MKSHVHAPLILCHSRIQKRARIPWEKNGIIQKFEFRDLPFLHCNNLVNSYESKLLNDFFQFVVVFKYTQCANGESNKIVSDKKRTDSA